ncbi:MAG: 5-formyltetrahydrofolate cyclo-ligase, partial [Phycisphaerae bacterium]
QMTHPTGDSRVASAVVGPGAGSPGAMLLKAGIGVYIVRMSPNEGWVKKELRAKLRSVLESISPETLQEQSQEAARRLFSTVEYRRAEILMIYLSLPREADTTPIVLQAWKDLKRVLAPQISWESKQMVPIEINNLDTDIADTMYDMREPVRGTPIPIVPGLGFDPHGNRLGRGRGFYDRFLGRPNFRGVICALAHEQQFVDSIPSRPHDQKVHLLVTNERVRRFSDP